MKVPAPSVRPDSSLSCRAWLLILAIAAVGCLITIAASRGASKGVAVDIRLNTNGVATVLGIPLAKGSVRDFMLRTFSRARVPVRVVVPSGGSAAPGWDTNAVQTMNAILKAGLISTNKPSGPSPYE